MTSPEDRSETPLLDEWRAQVGDVAIADAVKLAREKIANGSLPGLFDVPNLVDQERGSHRRPA